MLKLDEASKKAIRNCYNQIDNLLKQECLFCGPILIDMVDNEIEGSNTYSEFGSSPMLTTDEPDIWTIK
jgi:hypothetical protein